REPVHVVDRGAPGVELLPLRPRGDQPVEVAGLQLVRVLRQRAEVGDAEVAGPRGEGVGEGRGREGGETAGAAAGDQQPAAVDHTGLRQVAGAAGRVLHVHLAPAAVEPLAVGAAVAAGPAVVDVQDREPPGGPERAAGGQAGYGA